MSATPSVSQTRPSTSRPSSTPTTASQHREKGRTHGLELILFLLEQSRLTLFAIPIVIGLLAVGLSGSWIAFFLTLAWWRFRRRDY